MEIGGLFLCMENQSEQEPSAASVFDTLRDEHAFAEVGYGLRFGNFIADTVVIFILSLVLAFVLSYLVIVVGWVDAENVIAWSESTDLETLAVRQLIGLALSLAVYTFFEGATKGRTVGKFITGTVAVRMDGSSITWRDAFLRSLCRFIPFEPFSTFADNGPWHDQFTNTRVVHKHIANSLVPHQHSLPPDA